MKKVEKINQIVEKSEARKEKLADKISKLREEAKHLQSEKENALQEAIINDTKVDKKVDKDLKAVHEDIKESQEELQNVDRMVASSIVQMKNEIDKERNEFVKNHGEAFRDVFERMNKAKFDYLETVIEYSNMKFDFDNTYRRTFRHAEELTGLREKDTHFLYHLNPNQKHQIADKYCSYLTPEENREALQGRLAFHTAKNREAFKK